jgi:hypothetical protein
MKTVEGYFSIFKRGMKGVFQHCDEKRLHRCLAEFDFRYNDRVALGSQNVRREPLRQAPHVPGTSLSPDFKFVTRRFLRWRKKQPQPKVKGIWVR